MKTPKIILIILILFTFFIHSSFAGYINDQGFVPASSNAYVSNEVLVKFKTSNKKNSPSSVFGIASSLEKSEENIFLKNTLINENIGIYETKENIDEVLKRLNENPDVDFAQPNYIYTPAIIDTNDTYKENMWGLDNTGQTVNGTTGVLDADMDAVEAWQINNEGTNVPIVVAVVDNGVAYNHPDLVGQMWDGTNCKDENGNPLGGCIHGYNYSNNTVIPLPVNSGPVPAHGTHIAGTIAATKNNGMGVIGVASNAKIMALSTAFTTENIIQAFDFARENGARVINASFGSTSYDTLFYQAIKRFLDAGGLLVVAASNDSSNNDTTASYPSSYNFDEVISVAATGQSDTLASFSNWGLTTVDVSAPGVNIYSTYCTSDCSDQNYGFMNGTSMATPHVVAMAALILGNNPSLSNLAVKNIILSTGDTIPSLVPKILTGKRVNLYNALDILDNLSSYIPNAGYTTDNLIPVSQINNVDGHITVNFKVKDSYPNLNIQLKDFSYSTDGGTTWQTPTGGDSSDALSTKWSNNNYFSKTDYSGNTYSFVFNSRSDSSPNINNSTSDDTKIRFKVTDGINTSDYVESEEFSITNFDFDLNIFQPSAPVSINANFLKIVGSTNQGSLIEVYQDSILVSSLELDASQINFAIDVPLLQNTINNFVLRVTEPIHGSIQEVNIPTITEDPLAVYPFGWVEQVGSGSRSWRSIASSSDGYRLVAVDGNVGTPYNYKYIYTSIDGGYNWIQRPGAGAYNWASVASSADGMKLIAIPGGDYSTGYLYTSVNGGINWTVNNSLGTIRGQAIASSPDGNKLIMVTGGRYYDGYIYLSTDGGINWTRKDTAGYRRWSSVDISSDGMHLVATSGSEISDTGYIYTSTDGGINWTERTSAGLRRWISVVSSDDGSKIVAVSGGESSLGYVYVSNNGGESWQELTDLGLKRWRSVSSSSDGDKIIVVGGSYPSDQNGIYVSDIYISNDGGESWIIQSDAGANNFVSTASSSSGDKFIVGVKGGYIYTYNNCSTSPSISTTSATSITKTGATLNGSITATGGEDIAERGFQYGLDTQYGTTTLETGTFQTGNYSSSISSLTCGTTYHYRSYATNSMGTSYGEDTVFTTSNCSSGGGGGGGSFSKPQTTPVLINTPEKEKDNGCLSGYLYNVNTGQKCSVVNINQSNVETKTVINTDRVLKYGMTGQDVKQLQIYLNNHNYPISLSGIGSLNNETTYFGIKTKQAVIKFQLANGLIGDGIVGKITRGLLK